MKSANFHGRVTDIRSVIAGVGGALNYTKPKYRPFSLVDPSISYPLVNESISIVNVGLIALAAPAILITFVCLLLIPGRYARQSMTRSQAMRRKVWELYAGLTGLALSVALGYFITQGLKITFGKTRPHLLAACNPDLANVEKHIVGGLGQGVGSELVNYTICQDPESGLLRSSFLSFPSGHCSFSFSGLLYFSLFICAKFSFTIPYLPLQPMYPIQSGPAHPSETELLPLHQNRMSASSDSKTSSIPQTTAPPTQPPAPLPLYNQAATPPNYGLLLFLIPLFVAAYIASTRYSEYWHDGFDVISGSLIGIGTAWFSFRWYHLPISRGHGWAWGPRTRSRAFAIRVGDGGYVGPEGWQGVPASAAVG